ncbi:MAG: hypothetical protein V4617_15210 [Gemmatimonadota bacterium]
MSTLTVPSRTLTPSNWYPHPNTLDREALIALLSRVCAFRREYESRIWYQSLVHSLSASQFTEVWLWARELAWGIDGVGTTGVLVSRLALPTVLAHLADDEVASIDAMLTSKTLRAEQLVHDEADRP